MTISRQAIRNGRAFLLLGVLLVLVNAIWHPLEPRYQGKRLAVWAEDLSNPGDSDGWPGEQAMRETHQESLKAAEVIRHLGARALPLALQYCATKDSAIEKKFKDWVNYHQKVFEIHLPSDGEYQERGIKIVGALGPAAKPAIPSLIRLMQQEDPGVFNTASSALYYIGSNSIPFLIEALTNSNNRIREGAALTLGGFEEQARDAVPDLIRCLQDESPRVRACAALHLGRMGGDPTVVVPALLPCLKDKDLHVREFAAMSLGHTRAYPERVVPALIACIEAETNTPVPPPRLFFTALARFGTNARSAVPTLVKIVESDKKFDWRYALGAIRSIDPETADGLIRKHDFLRTNIPPQLPSINSQAAP